MWRGCVCVLVYTALAFSAHRIQGRRYQLPLGLELQMVWATIWMPQTDPGPLEGQ